MKLLIKSDWRGIFMAYLIDFQQKPICMGDYPTSSAILDQEPIVFNGFFRFFILVFKAFFLIRILALSRLSVVLI